jgi:polyphosphate kinase
LPHKTYLREILDLQLTNIRNVWEMQPDGSYIQLRSHDEHDAACVHHYLIAKAEKRATAGRLALAKKKRKKLGPKR